MAGKHPSEQLKKCRIFAVVRNLDFPSINFRFMKKYVILPLLALSALFLSQAAHGQSNPWKTLAKIDFVKKMDPNLGFQVDVPEFAEEVKALDGQEIIIKGYIIPVEGYKGHKEFVFSAYPYNMCFFCGGAGPETVMEVYADEAVEYTPDPITLRGKLELNAEDANRLIYALHGAVLAEGEGS